MEYLLLSVLWIAWCAVHSGMISRTVTGCLKRRSRKGYRYYRLFYNLIAVVTLVPLLVYGRGFPDHMLFRWEGWLAAVQGLLLLVVAVLLIAGAVKYDLQQFLGIRQIHSGKQHATLSQSGAMDTSGVLKMTRHPWYLSAMIFVWISYGTLYVSTLIVNCILSCYIIIGTVLEERKLLYFLGDSYREYQKEVSMLFPVKWISAQLHDLFTHR